MEERQEVLYVAGGSGTLHVNGEPHRARAGHGRLPDSRATATRVENPGPDELLAVSVTAPQDDRRGRRSRRHRAVRGPAGAAGEPEPRVPLPRQPGHRLPRRDPVRRDDPARPGRHAQPRLRRGRLRDRGGGRAAHRRAKRRRSARARASTCRRSSSTVSRTPALTRCACWASFIHREILLHGPPRIEREGGEPDNRTGG